jgi:hypothetical protein
MPYRFGATHSSQCRSNNRQSCIPPCAPLNRRRRLRPGRLRRLARPPTRQLPPMPRPTALKERRHTLSSPAVQKEKIHAYGQKSTGRARAPCPFPAVAPRACICILLSLQPQATMPPMWPYGIMLRAALLTVNTTDSLSGHGPRWMMSDDSAKPTI